MKSRNCSRLRRRLNPNGAKSIRRRNRWRWRVSAKIMARLDRNGELYSRQPFPSISSCNSHQRSSASASCSVTLDFVVQAQCLGGIRRLLQLRIEGLFLFVELGDRLLHRLDFLAHLLSFRCAGRGRPSPAWPRPAAVSCVRWPVRARRPRSPCSPCRRTHRIGRCNWSPGRRALPRCRWRLAS